MPPNGDRRAGDAAGHSVGKSKATELTAPLDFTQAVAPPKTAGPTLGDGPSVFDDRVDQILLALLRRRNRSVGELAGEADVPTRGMSRLLSQLAAVAAEALHRRARARP